MNLTDKIAIVTGGGRNLGKAIAIRLANAGANLVIASPDWDDLHATSSDIERTGRLCLPIETDVSDEAQVKEMVKQTLNRFQRIDVLVNNAGIIGPTAQVEKVSRTDWDEVMAVNLTGAFLCAKAVLPQMRSQKCGKIINISSIAGRIAYPLRSPYAVSKWGMIGLTMTIAKEVGPDNIQVNAICPGPVEGERMNAVIQRRAAELSQTPEEARRIYEATAVLNRMVRPDDIAEMVAYLASEYGDNITGQSLEVSAGYGL